MPRLSKLLEKAENQILAAYQKNKSRLSQILLCAVLILYSCGFILHSLVTGLHNVWNKTDEPLFTLNPIENIGILFSTESLAILLVGAMFWCLFSKKGYRLFSGCRTIFDRERDIEILSEGTHGTSGWMKKKRAGEVLQLGSLQEVDRPLFGKLDENSHAYVGLRCISGMNQNIIVYGAPGTGKSRGFVMPFVLQAARRGESLILADPKAEFYEMYSEFLRQQGYSVQTYNLLDLAASDGWNCLMDSFEDNNLVQTVAEAIIRNTSNAMERQDFWEKAEKNLLMALIYYVQSLTYPNTDKLLPPENRSLGTIYQILASTTVSELDMRFGSLPASHPALPPYGIFKQAHRQIWGNIVLGLGTRLNVFQNKLVNSITRHHEFDLERPGKEKCAYFCIISDQDSSLSFLSSLFFSLLFVRLFNLARTQENRRLPVCVNVLIDEFCNIDVLDFKRILSTARSRNINIQAAIQSIAQLADRYPKTEWQELVGNCDYQLFLGCNDIMTAEFISRQCGEITVRVNNASEPLTPPFSTVLHAPRPYTHSKTSTGRALMMPDEIRRLPRNQAILLMRGEKPLKLYKITPEEHPSFKELIPCKAKDHVPQWHAAELCATVAPCPQVSSYWSDQPEIIHEEEAESDQEDESVLPAITLPKGIDCRELREVEPKDL